MQKLLGIVLVLMMTTACQKHESNYVNTSDIDLFWEAYDQIILENDTVKQAELLTAMYLSKGSTGLDQIVAARGYTAEEYISLINDYPLFWKSIRENTFKSKHLAGELNEGIAKLEAIYPKLKPAKIYFTIGAMRTNGTTRDSSVLIGSELAMADDQTDISEFSGRSREWLETYFGANPIDGLVLLNVHEYVHTQQKPIAQNLLYQVVYEGIAEFVSVKAMNVPSDAPAIEFGKNNPGVRELFEQEMFHEKTYEWMWSSAPNDFGVRDLGYYIGYAIAEIFYENNEDKLAAIETLIELDYSNQAAIDQFIDETHFFSRPIGDLRHEFETAQPSVIGIAPFENNQQEVNHEVDSITIHFSQPMSYGRNFQYGPLGEEAVVRFKQEIGFSADSTSYTFEIEPLLPGKQYQLVIGSGFRDRNGLPLKPYLIDFKTRPAE